MADNKKLEQLKYDDKVRTNNKGKAVLGTLEGPCAEFIAPTRNGRYYSEELWEKVFQNPLVKEQLDCGGIFGELGHPDDRDETDATKIAITIAKLQYLILEKWDINKSFLSFFITIITKGDKKVTPPITPTFDKIS